MAISITVDAITGNELPKALNLVLISGVMLQCIALLMLGYILQSDVPEDVAATA
jgi:hypothetical protein